MVEDIANSRKVHFELILTENPSQTEMDNIRKERALRVDVSKASENLQNAINEWQRQTNRNDMNLLIVKKDDFIKSFPILDPSDVEILEAHKEQLLALFP